MSLDPRDPGYSPAPSYANQPYRLGSTPPPAVPASLPEQTCSRCKETAAWCDEDGCPYCQDEREQKPWIDPCQTCARYRDEAFWAAVRATPGWFCEYDSCTVCEVCSKCSKTGQVCRICTLCLEHQDDGMAGSPCEYTVWSRARKREVEYFEHKLWDTATERWAP